MVFSIPSLEISYSLFDNLGTSKPAYGIAPRSSPLSFRVALYLIGRDLKLGIEDTLKLPESVRTSGTLVCEDAHKRTGRGAYHKDAVQYIERNNAPNNMRQPKNKNYVLARYFYDIAGFEEYDGKWKLQT